jgi:hypothetical protein
VRELYIRRLFFAPPARPHDYDMKCKRAVRAEVGRCSFTPSRPRVDLASFQRWKLKDDELISRFAFKLNLRRYRSAQDTVLRHLLDATFFTGASDVSVYTPLCSPSRRGACGALVVLTAAPCVVLTTSRRVVLTTL